MTRRFLPISLVQLTVLLSLAALSMHSQAQSGAWPQKRRRNPVYWRVAYEVYFKIDEIKLKGDTVSKL